MVALLTGYVLFGLYLIASMPPELDRLLWQNYVTDLTAYFVMAGLACVVFAKRGYNLVDPIVLVSALYISLFSVAPIRDIIVGDYLTFGVNTLTHGVQATVIAVAGYLCLVAGYLLRLPMRSLIGDRSDTAARGLIARRALAIWVAAFVVALVSAMASGKGANYILTLGLLGDAAAEAPMDTPLGFGAVVGQAMIPTAIVYAHTAGSRWLTGLVQLLTFTVLASQGFRYVIIIFVLAHAFVWYAKRKTKPRVTTIALLVAGLALFSGVMGAYRGALRTGGSMEWSSVGIDAVETAVFENLAIYKTYYGVVHAVPELVPYGLGSQIFVYTVIMFIPRMIWAAKPLPEVWAPIRAGVSDYAAEAGSAYPNVGEYYYEFGLLGVLIFMFLFGLGLNFVRSKYMTSNRIAEVVLYGVIVAASFQLIIRGYTPSNFYMVLVLAVPTFIIRGAKRKKRSPWL